MNLPYILSTPLIIRIQTKIKAEDDSFCFIFLQTTHVQTAKSRILREISGDEDVALSDRSISRFSNIEHDYSNIRREYGTKISGRSRRWSHRRRLGAIFSPWSGWSHCDYQCQQRRERHCRVRKKCGHSKHIEERRCPHFA